LPLFCEHCGNPLPWTKKYIDELSGDVAQDPEPSHQLERREKGPINPPLGGGLDGATLARIERAGAYGAAAVKVIRASLGW
jgi:hypothetical protein